MSKQYLLSLFRWEDACDSTEVPFLASPAQPAADTGPTWTPSLACVDASLHSKVACTRADRASVVSLALLLGMVIGLCVRCLLALRRKMCGMSSSFDDCPIPPAASATNLESRQEARAGDGHREHR